MKYKSDESCVAEKMGAKRFLRETSLFWIYPFPAVSLFVSFFREPSLPFLNDVLFEWPQESFCFLKNTSFLYFKIQ